MEQDKLNRIVDLINIRNFIVNTPGNYNLDKPTINTLSDMLTLMDKKIASLLLSDEFKEFVGYTQFQKQKEELRELNIKSAHRK